MTVPNSEVVVPDETAIPKPEVKAPAKKDAYRLELEAAKAEKQELEKRLALIEEEQDVKLKNYESLWRKEQEKNKLYESKLSETEEKRKQDKQVFFTGLKQSAIEAEALTLGIDKTCMKFLTSNGFDEVEVEVTSSGNVNLMGVKEYVQKFKDENPRLFTTGNDPNINLGNNAAAIGDKQYTPAEVLKLQVEDPKLYMQIIRDPKKYIKRA